MVQIEVLVKNRQTGIERTITYKSFLDLQSTYELIGQIDENGKLVPGSPNLQPQHRKQQPKNVAAHAVGEGDDSHDETPVYKSETEVVSKEEQNSEMGEFPVERKKVGRPKKIIA